MPELERFDRSIRIKLDACFKQRSGPLVKCVRVASEDESLI